MKTTYIFLMLLVGGVVVALAGDFPAQQQAMIKMNEDVTWNYTTIALCFLGWVIHWLMGWGEEWKKRRLSLIDNILQNLPAFIASVAAAVALYLIGPGFVAMIGLDLAAIPPQPAATIAKLGAFLGGYMADSFIAKLAALMKKVTQ